MEHRLRWIVAVGFVSLSLASAQDRTQLMSEAALQENWSQVAALAGNGDGLGPVERLLAGHANLALNRNNESLANFLTVTTPAELGEWRDWACGLREKNPGSAIAYYFQGDALARLHEWPAAIAAFSAGLNLTPGNALLLNARGVSFAATWELDRALVDLTTATKVNPRLADAFVSLGSIWAQQQRGATGATRALDKALTISPDSVVALTLRSGVRMVEGEFPAAQADVGRALKQAGQLTPAVQARLLDMAELLRDQPAKEVQQALASGQNPGTLINRELQNLQQGQPGSLDKLMTIAQMFPDQQPVISSGIKSAAQASAAALQSANAGFARLSQADMLTKAVGTPTNLTLGPAYAMAIGLPQDPRMNFTPPPAPSPRVDFSAMANNLSTASTVVGAMKNMIPENKFTNLSLGLDVGSQGLGLLAAGLSGNAQQMHEQLIGTGLWGLGQAAATLQKAYPIGSDLHVSQAFVDRMSLVDPIQNLLSASTSQIGDGRWLPNQTQQTQYLNAAHGLLSFDYNSQFTFSTATKTFADLSTASKLGWGSALGATAGLPDMANFLASRFQSGWTSPFTVNQTVSFWDSVAKTTSYTAAFMASGGNTNFASGVSTLVGVAADQGRQLTMPLFQRLDFGANAQISSIYNNYAASQSARNLPILSQSQFLNPPNPPSRNTDQFSGASVTQNLSYTALSGHMITGTSTFSQMNSSNSNNPMASSEATRLSMSYTDSFNGAQANQSIPRIPDPVTPKPTFTPLPPQTPDFTNFYHNLQQSVGFGSGAAAAPGGFRTGMAMPYWEDGEWPIRPWYGLGYVVNDQPPQGAREVRQ